MREYKSTTISGSPISVSVFGVAVSLFLAGCSPTADDCDRNKDEDCDRSGGSYVPHQSHAPSGNSTKPKSGFFSFLGGNANPSNHGGGHSSGG